MKRSLCFAAALLMLLAPLRASSAEGGDDATAGAQAAALIEASTQRVVLEHDAEKKLPMASTTKIMTALIAIERCGLDEMVAVPDAAVGTEGSSMYLRTGEKLSMRDLLYGLMLTSGNDAAVAIAVHIGGSVEQFADLMNKRARQLGCLNTHFVTPNGLHRDDHYTTALDLARITTAAMQNETFRTVVGTTYYQTTTGDHIRYVKNKNRTLWQYEGGCGVKTGYTKASGRCLAFAAKRGDTLLIGVILNAPKLWDVAFGMLDKGFDTIETRTFMTASQSVRTIPVQGGEKKTLELVAKDGILYPIDKNGADSVELRVTAPAALTAPVEAGQAVGTLTLYVNGRDVASTELCAAESVGRAGFFDRLFDALAGRAA